MDFYQFSRQRADTHKVFRLVRETGKSQEFCVLFVRPEFLNSEKVQVSYFDPKWCCLERKERKPRITEQETKGGSMATDESSQEGGKLGGDESSIQVTKAGRRS